MLVACWSPKGGSGTSVFAAACALAGSHDQSVRLADLVGDQPAILGLGSDPPTGLREWLRVGLEAPVDALAELAVDIGPSVTLLPAGRASIGAVDAEVGAALAVALQQEPGLTIADVGCAGEPVVDAFLEVADVTIIVVRGCYVALRRAVRLDATARAAGAVFIEEPGRALGARDIADVLGVPVLATVAVRSSIARIVDAGVLSTRLPDGLVRPARKVLQKLGLADREGRAA